MFIQEKLMTLCGGGVGGGGGSDDAFNSNIIFSRVPWQVSHQLNSAVAIAVVAFDAVVVVFVVVVVVVFRAYIRLTATIDREEPERRSVTMDGANGSLQQ
ncbi:hypothetical protein GQX74_004120 [Glossina fuscipes]|nr:hypothetical protein GQX74_004120 [Glossina fuscipes]